jgi:hypothetical protein
MNEPTFPIHSPASAEPAYAGDHGVLPIDSRRVLCKLLSGPSLDGDSPLWPALYRDEALLRSRLSELFLELVLDLDRKIAFVRPADTGELDTPVLLRSIPLTYIDSVLVLHLRQLLVGAELQGQRAAVDESELVEHLALFAGEGGDDVKAARRIAAAIDKMKSSGVLHALRGADKRFEISPTLRLLFGPSEVQAVLEAYRALAGIGGASKHDDEVSHESA